MSRALILNVGIAVDHVHLIVVVVVVYYSECDHVFGSTCPVLSGSRRLLRHQTWVVQVWTEPSFSG